MHSILLVDDNPDDELLALSALMHNNIANRVDVAHDGVEALAYLWGDENQPARDMPQVVLLDLKLPKIDGLEVLGRIRASEQTRLVLNQTPGRGV